MPRKKLTVAKVKDRVVTFAGDADHAAKLTPQKPQPDNSNKGVSARGPPELLTVEEAADLLRLTKSTLDKWRVKGVGPKFIYVGRLVRYTRLHLAEDTAQAVTSTSQRTGRMHQLAGAPPD
jgi:hypothetical protein